MEATLLPIKDMKTEYVLGVSSVVVTPFLNRNNEEHQLSVEVWIDTDEPYTLAAAFAWSKYGLEVGLYSARSILFGEGVITRITPHSDKSVRYVFASPVKMLQRNDTIIFSSMEAK